MGYGSFPVLYARQGPASNPVRVVLRGPNLAQLPTEQIRLVAEAIGEHPGNQEAMKARRKLLQMAAQADARAQARRIDWSHRTDPEGTRRSCEGTDDASS